MARRDLFTYMKMTSWLQFPLPQEAIDFYGVFSLSTAPPPTRSECPETSQSAHITYLTYQHISNTVVASKMGIAP